MTFELPPSVLFYLTQHVRHRPHSVAWIERTSDFSREPRSITWDGLSDLLQGVSDLLFRKNVRRGDRIAIWGFNSLDWVLTDLACTVLGATSVPLDPRISTQMAKEILDRVAPKLTLLGKQHLGRVAGDPLPDCREIHSQGDSRWLEDRLSKEWDWNQSQPATILFTSGTTDTPKGVMLSHRNLVSNAIAKLIAMPQFSNDHRVNLLPFAHAYARTCELTAWLISGSSMEISHGQEDFLERLTIAKPSLINAVPSVYATLIDRLKTQTTDAIRSGLGGNIRQLASGGAPLPDRLREVYQNAGLPIYQGYGLTETSPVVCSNIHPDSGAPACLSGVGPPVMGSEIRIDFRSQLWVRGSNLFMGYWKDPDATERRWKYLDDQESGAWFSTGDLARTIEGSDAIEILGRADDTIVLSNGYKLNPLILESQLIAIPAVQDCIVVPASQGRWRVCLQMESDHRVTPLVEMIEQIQHRCSREFRDWMADPIICLDPWTIESGLLNFKGAKRRAEFAKRFGR
ncbi:AMP-binding protein [Pirellulaceae bacterium SH501]